MENFTPMWQIEPARKTIRIAVGAVRHAAQGPFMRQAILAALAILTAAPQVSAETIRRPRIVVVALPETEAVGCYWKHGRQFCSRYCYWEVNGRRYCHDRAREAYPQGPAPELYYEPMKLGAGR